jgi:hypothetical protein
MGAYFQSIVDHKQKWGIDPRVVYSRGNLAWSVWYHVTDPFWMTVVHAAILVTMLCFALGFCTRVTSVLTWLAVLSYIQRGPTTLFGMDTMMLILIIYLAIGPSGAALSLDRLIERWWARRRARLKGQPPPPDLPPRPRVTANFAIRMMQIHFCFIYIASGLSKLQGGAWWYGTALWGTMANPSFNPVDVPIYFEFLLFLCRYRLLWEIVTTGGVAYTLAVEIGFPFLVWNRKLRPLMIAGAVLLHTGIALVMGLVGFGLCMLCLLMSFVPPEAVRRLLDAVAPGPRQQPASFGLRPAQPAETVALSH